MHSDTEDVFREEAPGLQNNSLLQAMDGTNEWNLESLTARNWSIIDRDTE